MSLTEGSLRLFKFVPDEFVTSLPPCCNSNYLGYGITLAGKHDKMRASWPKLKE
ncbi:hypothetical protein CUC49_19255 [Citrobacter pasteurii]|nr:hypothetical protein CUC49_19255 [Citrobacter pasteurii]